MDPRVREDDGLGGDSCFSLTWTVGIPEIDEVGMAAKERKEPKKGTAFLCDSSWLRIGEIGGPRG